MAKRTDANQVEIVRGLRAVGASVLPMAELGNGAPDIAVGWRGYTWFFELKDGTKPPSQRKLTPAEKKFHDEWRGHLQIVTCLDEALDAIGLFGRGSQA